MTTLVHRLFLVSSLLLFNIYEVQTFSFVGTPLLVKNLPKTASTSQLSMRTPIIDNWRVLGNGRITGTVRFHPSIPDGDVITTSPIENPDQAASKMVVTTFSGSTYQLGTSKDKKRGDLSIADLKKIAKTEYGLTGEIIGDDSRQYLLASRPVKSTSGKSRIYEAYRSDPDGLPTGELLTVKVSNNWEAMEREAKNYARITKGLTRGKFTQLYDYIESPASLVTKKFSSFSALVLEHGAMDLKRYVAEQGRLEGKELRNAAAAAAQCLQAVHASGLVWTDLKSENFVVTKDGKIKGIDLESAMPVRDNPVDYSPEATPPEFAAAFLSGEGPYFELDYSYDAWSLGIFLYELGAGRGYWDGLSPMQITKGLRAGPRMNVEAVEDPSLRDLVRQCLQLDPRKRPKIVQILLHPYFLKTGIGPLSF